MELCDLPLAALVEAPWNPNIMTEDLIAKLRRSIQLFGTVENLVVRPLDGNRYEVLNGNQRLRVYRDLAQEFAPCFVADLDEVHARLLAQALNRIQGEDDLGLKAELLRSVLAELPEADVLALLPESAESLAALASLAQDDLAAQLQAWQQAQAARLKHLQVQLTAAQLEVVEEALSRFLPVARAADSENPNRRGLALYFLCRRLLELEGNAS